jgi:hypothetical protein
MTSPTTAALRVVPDVAAEEPLAGRAAPAHADDGQGRPDLVGQLQRPVRLLVLPFTCWVIAKETPAAADLGTGRPRTQERFDADATTTYDGAVVGPA